MTTTNESGHGYLDGDEGESGYEYLIDKWATIDGQLLFVYEVREENGDFSLLTVDRNGKEIDLDIRSIREVSA